MQINDEILQEVEAGLIGQQRVLSALRQKREDYPDLADMLDPLIVKLAKICEDLTVSRDELRLLVVAQRA